MTKHPLILKFDKQTIKHLGIQLYSTLPPVLGELIANAYDANAKNVQINIVDFPKKSIIIKDDGDGMSYEDLRIRYLEIGRDRRKDEELQQRTKRPPIGKKGIGKLSGFGIAKNLIIKTVNNKIKNVIELDYEEILNTSKNTYTPKLIIDEEKTNAPNGSKIILTGIKRTSAFERGYLDILSADIARRFSIISNDFNVELIYNGNETDKVEVTNELRFINLEIEFEWKIPLQNFESNYRHKRDIIGKIYATKGPVLKSMKGVYLISRGKMVNQPDFFGSDNQDYAFTHLTGWLDISFIEELNEDVISTSRESLNWEAEETIELKNYLQLLLTNIKDEWREERRRNKIIAIEKIIVNKIDTWIDGLKVTEDKKLAKKIIDTIIKSDSIETEKSAELITYIQNTFEFESFKHYAREMAELDKIDQTELFKLLKDWEIIESREIYNLSRVRIEAIKNLEKHIDDNALEVSIMQQFFTKFPWILDPQIMKFENESRYSNILKKHFAESDDIPEIDRRLDFLCVNHLGQFFVIELKRPQSKIKKKQLDQAFEYSTFIKSHLSNEYDPHVTSYIIGGHLSADVNDKEIAKIYRDSRKVIFKPYEELLKQAKNYHQEFIDTYEHMKLL